MYINLVLRILLKKGLSTFFILFSHTPGSVTAVRLRIRQQMIISL
ncbi:MAG: hypothetical protein JWM56_1328 [Candidatus Peribacteria bacterium]|nr:hypothetical protein [Candidatus Peribacteria bacterium]